MEPDQPQPAPRPSSLRWQILRRALLRRPSNSGENIGLEEVSRQTRSGFNLIPCRVVNNPDSLSRSDVCFHYTLPLPNAPQQLCLLQRWEDCVVDLNDFKVCNQYDIDNAGLVCQWPSEDVLAYYYLSHLDYFRNKRVMA